MSNDYSVILTTASERSDAEKIAEILVNEKLAACVQIMPITSYYRWEDSVHNDAEWLVMIKGRAGSYHAVESTILAHHPYDIPEIIQILVAQGFKPYLDWIDQETKS